MVPSRGLARDHSNTTPLLLLRTVIYLQRANLPIKFVNENSPSGDLISSWPVPHTAPNAGAFGLAIDLNGDILVTTYDEDGILVKMTGINGSVLAIRKDVAVSAIDVAVDDGSVFVDSNWGYTNMGFITKLSPNCTIIAFFNAEHEFSVFGLSIDHSRDLMYVSGYGILLQMFNTSGLVIRRLIALKGDVLLFSLVLPDGDVIVIDRDDGAYEYDTNNGRGITPITMRPSPKQRALPYKIARDIYSSPI